MTEIDDQPPSPIRIGTVTMRAHTQIEDPFSAVGWCEFIACDTQTVPLMFDGSIMSCTVGGTISGVTFGSHFGGVVTNPNAVVPDAPKVGAARAVQVRWWGATEFMRGIIRGEFTFRLDAGYGLRFARPTWRDGRVKHGGWGDFVVLAPGAGHEAVR